MRRIAIVLIFVGLLMISVSVAQTAVFEGHVTISLPPNFVATMVSDELTLPVDMVRLPSGEFLVAEKGSGEPTNSQSRIQRVPTGETVLTLRTTTSGEAGIAGLILDPQFAQNGYFYVLYVTGQEAIEWGGEPTTRLSRFTYDNLMGVADPASEQILLDVPSTGVMLHFGGGMAFDANGRLYVGLGENGVSVESQNEQALIGKVLRLEPTADGYVIPADNPFVIVADAPDEIYALGMRNPFRMTYIPARDELFAVDVGGAHWEEINLIAGGANYGWPYREGPCPSGQFQPCSAAPEQYTDPFYSEPHTDDQLGGSAITAVAYYDGFAFPEGYQHQLFFANYNNGTIHYLDLDTPTVMTLFAQDIYNIADMEVHDNRLFVLSVNSGQLIEIAYAPEGVPPVIRLDVSTSLTTSNSPISLTIRTAELDSTAWQYRWDFGDGSPVVTTEDPSIEYRYMTDGAYTIVVDVLDGNGQPFAPLTAEVVVYSGEPPQLQLVNLTDGGRALYHAGDQIQYEVTRSTTADLDADTPFEWNIYLHHNQHTHPVVFGYPTTGDVLEVPVESHDFRANVWYRFEVVMYTQSGLRVPVSQELFPAVAHVRMSTAPSDFSFELNGVDYQSPFEFYAVVGEHHAVEADPSGVTQTDVYEFVSWFASYSTDPIDSPTIALVVPNEGEVTLRADYVYARPSGQLWLPLIHSP